jgi:adhesin transport system membrane fusion protein
MKMKSWKEIKEWLDPGETDERHDDVAFMPDVEAAIRASGAHFAYLLSIITTISIALFIFWAAIAKLDEVTKGDAQVIPSSKIQLIQSLDGGVVSELLVREGEIVEKDQVLLRIDNLSAQTNLMEREARYNYLQGMVARLDAEINGTELVFPEVLKQKAPQIITEQINQYNLRQSQRSAELSVLESQTSQRNSEVREMAARLQQLNGNLRLKEEELNMRRPLVAQGAMSKVELLRIEGEVMDLRGEINTINTAVPRAKSAVAEAQQRIGEVKAKFRSEAQNELGAAKAEMDSLTQILRGGADKVERTQLKSPVKGTVKQITANTIGGVIKPGEDVMEIVPLNDTLLIEAKVPPKDIAFIRPDQKAIVKITAYDYSIYGGLNGEVEGISADTIQNEKGESFYRVTIRTKDTVMIHNGKELPIIPGMTANVQILTGRKSVLDYLLKPIMKARQEALRER